jgi:hypothetical protein
MSLRTCLTRSDAVFLPVLSEIAELRFEGDSLAPL